MTVTIYTLLLSPRRSGGVSRLSWAAGAALVVGPGLPARAGVGQRPYRRRVTPAGIAVNGAQRRVSDHDR
ncbi:MAG TPA: hypothetical protein VFZ66_13510 [Herpetosiphonaceae bacterium]